MNKSEMVRSISISLILQSVLMADALQIQAVRSTEYIQLDGLPDEKVWQSAPPAPELVQQRPQERGKPSQLSDIRLVFDSQALYVGARFYDSAPDSIVARLGRRDSEMNSDIFIIGLDPYYDKRSGYYFGLSAAGTIYDGIFYNDNWQDDSWDGVWEGVVRRNRDGWSLEMRIPFSQLRFKKSSTYLWGINLYRRIQRKNEEDLVVITPSNESGIVSRFVDLVGIENIDASRQVEILPYFRSKAEYRAVESGDPFNDGSRYFMGTGADFKIGIGNNMTIDATINPDFGQVEVDPAVINLSDVETYYNEKRPFFIEGSKTFDFGVGGASDYWNINFSPPGFFYSRRIGRTPQADLSNYDYVDLPEGARIITAGKVTGKIGNNWNLGLLNALTAREYARVSSADQSSRVEAEPLTNYTVLRTQKEFKEGRHGVGLISTLTKRFFKDGGIKDILNSEALVVGLDGWAFLDTQKTWVISGWSGTSYLTGSQNCITNVQTNSRHYLQRPDANHVRLDSSATTLSGFATRLCLNKQKGNVILNAALGWIDPKFDVNDLGYISVSDIINYHVGLGYRWTKPTKAFRSANLILANVRSMDCGGNTVGSGLMNFGYYQFLNYYQVQWGGGWFFKAFDNRLTRGGPLVVSPAGFWGYLNFSSDDRKPLSVRLYMEASGNRVGSYSRYFQIPLEWKPADNLSIEVAPELNISRNMAQWVDAYDDTYATATYGKRYVFAELNQTTLSAGVRFDWTFTPRLSFQLYAQPLFAAGDYHKFKELKRPKSYQFLIYGQDGSTIDPDNLIVDPDGPSPDGPANSFTIDNPDFNVYSYRSSAVLRWEFARGSALYLVWTHNRFNNDSESTFDLNRSLDRLRELKPDNIFMVKVSYWFNR